jgi:hypothetical protein
MYERRAVHIDGIVEVRLEERQCLPKIERQLGAFDVPHLTTRAQATECQGGDGA